MAPAILEKKTIYEPFPKRNILVSKLNRKYRRSDSSGSALLFVFPYYKSKLSDFVLFSKLYLLERGYLTIETSSSPEK